MTMHCNGQKFKKDANMRSLLPIQNQQSNFHDDKGIIPELIQLLCDGI